MAAAAERVCHFTRDDRAESMVRYVPVDVPPGTRTIRVQLGYDTSTAVLDLGCFAPGDRFRGWSGGSRREFAISESYATPGYLPGELDPGHWAVALGLHRVPADGITATVTVELSDRALGGEAEPAPPPPDRPALPVLPAPSGMRTAHIPTGR